MTASDPIHLYNKISELEADVKMLNERLAARQADMLATIVNLRNRLTSRTLKANRMASAATACFDTLEGAGWPDCAESLRVAISEFKGTLGSSCLDATLT